MIQVSKQNHPRGKRSNASLRSIDTICQRLFAWQKPEQPRLQSSRVLKFQRRICRQNNEDYRAVKVNCQQYSAATTPALFTP